MNTIMVVDDERDIRDSLSDVLRDEGYEVITAESAEEGLEKMATAPPDVVLLDIWMPGMDGVEMLKEVMSSYTNMPVIMISGHATIDTAVKTTRLGAYDFIEKPLSLDNIILTVSHALEQKSLKAENTALRESFKRDYTIIGETEVMRRLKADIERVAATPSWVLITGENGTGKEFVARNIHILSERSSKPFVEVNCAAIPEELIESELFGHEKGAFTSAITRKKGKFDIADRGTIFLDEIADMSLKTQAKILRILQEQTFERVGGNEQISVDVRVIAATNKNLKEEIRLGNFREDLYYRLNVIPFHVPPLRERSEDLDYFIDYFLKEFARSFVKKVPEMSAEATASLKSYEWPGNVRELKNLLERLVIMTPGSVIELADLPAYVRSDNQNTPATPDSASKTSFNPATLKEARAEFERDFIGTMIKEHDGNISKAAEALGVERSHLYRKIKSYGIET